MSNNKFVQKTPIPKLKKNAIDLSHEKKMTFEMADLVVGYWDDIIPGDTFKVKSEIFVRLAPMLAPVLHRIDVFMHYFFVPYRQIFIPGSVNFGGWEAFITGDPEQEFPSGSSIPYITMSNANKAYFNENGLADDFGIPPIEDVGTVTQDVDISALPFNAYQWIYDNYYRDENLIDKRCGWNNLITLTGGDHNSEIADLTQGQLRAWERDYFTSAMPTAYKGLSTDVELDLDVFGSDNDSFVKMVRANGTSYPTVGNPQFSGAAYPLYDAGGTTTSDRVMFQPGAQQSLVANLEISELRRAQALLRYYEAANRGGHRYSEQLLGIWGVISDDARLQIPEYLGGGKQTVQISDVMSSVVALDPTAGVNDGAGGVTVPVNPQADFSGKGTSMGKTNGFTKTFKEHGIVIGIVSVMPRTGYSEGIPKFFRKEDRTDFFIPQLQHIGEQAIDQSEVYYDPTGTDKDDIFGYTPRYAEYKHKNDSIHGEFRTSLDYWHCSRIFGTAPALNEAFVQGDSQNDEMTRIFAVESGVKHIYAQIYNDVKALRPMSLYSVPK